MSVQIAAALRGLADIAATVGGIRAALIAWPGRAPEEMRPTLVRLASRLELGAPISHAIGVLRSVMGPEADMLKAIVRLHLSSGAPIAPLLVAAADRLARSSETQQRMAAALAGMKASARLIAALPLVCVLFLPLDRSSLSDRTGLLLVAVGVVLGLSGFVWMKRVTPDPSEIDDPVADWAEFAAAALRAGAPLTEAFALASRGSLGPHGPHVERALRLVRLGSRWPDALALTGHAPLQDLGRLLASTMGTGRPLAPGLVGWARARRRIAATDFERAMRRAPVRMIPPLTLCVLPASVLLGLGPFVRGLTGII